MMPFGYGFGDDSSIAALGRETSRGLRERLAALRLFNHVRRWGILRRCFARLIGEVQCLLELNAVETASVVGLRHSAVQSIAIGQIRGSEGRVRDFDINFFPLDEHDRERWVGVAVAYQSGVALPPVELIQVGTNYYVRDGHHRISVARALGQEYIDAYVTVWAAAPAAVGCPALAVCCGA